MDRLSMHNICKDKILLQYRNTIFFFKTNLYKVICDELKNVRRLFF